MPADRFSLALGLQVASLATAIAIVLGVGLAWFVENRQFAGKRVVIVLVNAAIALPAPLLCYYLWASHPVFAGLTSAGVLSTLPMLWRSARSSFAALSPAYGKAARSLGTSEWRVFARVELPLALAPIGAGAALALVRVLLELAVAFRIAESRL